MGTPKPDCTICWGRGYVWYSTVDGDADSEPCECLDLDALPVLDLDELITAQNERYLRETQKRRHKNGQ